MLEAALPADSAAAPVEAPPLRALPPVVDQPPAPTRSIHIPECDLGAARGLERELGVSHVLAQVLVRRGLEAPLEARAFLDARGAHDPSEFEGIDASLALIRRHIEGGTRITVHGDYDVDGVCATAILIRALRSLGADVNWFLPSRIDDGYGVSSATIARLAARGTRLLITVDCGITAVEQVAEATAAGLDVIVTDHHAPQADGELPACPIVHPTVSGYPCRDLCGTGVAFKLAQALGAPSTDDDIELVALATVADLVPLAGENRRLVREGLRALANTSKPGLRALIEVARVDPSALDAQALGFRLAPRINAAGRMRRADAGLELLLTEDAKRAGEIAAELDRVNVERRAVEQRITWEAESQVAELGERSAYVLAGEGWHPGVIGIVASRIVERHHRPTILIALDDDRSAPAQGSGRSIPGFDLLAALHSAAGHMERYGGHRAAAGLTIGHDRIDGLRDAIVRYAEEHLTPELLRPVERIDAIVSGSELGLALAEELRALEPCGLGNPGPRLLIPGARFTDLRPMGEGRHARFSVISGGARARAVAFGVEGRLAADAQESLDATFKLERNSWNGAIEPRLVLRHSQPCAPGAIEVIGEPTEYLPTVLAELDVELDAADDADAALTGQVTSREAIDRRGASALAVLADAAAGGRGGDSVLAICAEPSRRLDGLAERAGGFALCSYHAVVRDPSLAARFDHLVALDPPAGTAADAALRAGSGFCHLAWGEPELRFAEQMHELEYGLRTPLVAVFRTLRDRGTVAGEELERLLRGDGSHGRPARLAGRVVRVLVELGLVSLDRGLPALTLVSTSSTELERSPAYRAYMQRYEDGKRYLSSANLRAGG
jgi:single-stranded-DNA-specific exonuclease